MPAKSTLLFLYLRTGGGHLAPARAVEEWIAQNRGEEANVVLHDGFTNVFEPVRWIVEDGYRQTQAKGKWMFEMLYAFNKLKPFAKLTSSMVSQFVEPRLEEFILAQRPSKIVVFHFFLIKPVRKILQKHNLNIPVLTVVTDPFTAPPIWFMEPGQHFVVFSQQLKQQIEETRGAKPSKVSVFPFIVNSKFSKCPTEESKMLLRKQLGIPANEKIILMLGGGDGIPKGGKLLRTFAKSNIDAHVIVVCGKNKSLFRKAIRIREQFSFGRLTVLGFIDYVYELLSISDIVVTKCGASTFTEILLSGKIPVVNSYIWEQEKGNVDFIRSNGMGVYEPNPLRVIQIVSELVSSSSKLESYRDNIRRMGLSNGTPHLSEYILQMQA